MLFLLSGMILPQVDISMARPLTYSKSFFKCHLLGGNSSLSISKMSQHRGRIPSPSTVPGAEDAPDTAGEWGSECGGTVLGRANSPNSGWRAQCPEHTELLGNHENHFISFQIRRKRKRELLGKGNCFNV